MTERNDIEELFSSVFEGAEMTPPDSVKEAIDIALFTTSAASKKNGKWWLWSLLLLLSLGGGGAVLLSNEKVLPDEERVQHAETSSLVSESIEVDSGSGTPGATGVASEAIQVGRYDLPSENVDRAAISDANHAGGNGFESDHDSDNFSDKMSPEDQTEQTTAGGHYGAKSIGADDHNPGTEKVADGMSSTAGNPEETRSLDAMTEKSKEVPSGKEAVNSMDFKAPIMFEGPGAALTMLAKARITNAPKQNPWTLAGYVGTSFGMNTLRGLPELKVEEQAGIYASVEALYSVKRSWMVSGGIDFTQRVDRLIQTSTINDSVFSGNNIVYIYDSSQIIIDSIVTPVYQPTTFQQEAAGRVRFYSIGVPIYLHYHIGLGRKLFLDLGAGIRCSYMKYTNEELVPTISYPQTYKQFGVNVSLRPEFVVPINRLQLGIYGRFEYDALHGMQWNAVTRTRWSAGFGLSLRYKL